jgi:hypothetical protein
MWILESEGDLFQGRRMWLKPGKTYLFGRVKRDGVRHALDHQAISRKHFTISVDDVKAGDSARIHARTKVTITDLKSKRGTYIDGSLLQDGSRDLSAEKHSIRPGTFPSELVIKWATCNLAFQLGKKELKAGALKAKTERLESIDIKVSSEYISHTTTHVVASKRNTVKGLQALIQGRYLVGDSFIDALVYAATPTDLGEEENLSPLEQDFERAWPKEMENLAPAGKEPTERPESTYKPDPKRVNIFEDYQFIFLDRSQYEILLPAITTGQGKALHYELKNDSTTADELVQYMRNAAGKKGLGDNTEDSLKGGAVMVRCEGHKDHEEWTASLINEVALKLDQRAIDQAEFIDAILATDASLLKQSVPFASTTDGRRPPPATPVDSFASIQLPPKGHLPQSIYTPRSQRVEVQSSRAALEGLNEPEASAREYTQLVPSSAPEEASRSQATPVEEPPRKKPRLRHVTGNRFKQFDDDFDVNAIPLYTQEDFPEDSQSYNSSVADSREQSVDNSVKEEPTTTRKRQRSPETHTKEVENSEDDHMDDMFPAAAAMRRQRAGLPAAKTPVRPPTIKKKRKETEIDVRETARAQRKAEEEAAKKEREAVAEELAHEDHSGKPANLVKIGFMTLRTKPPATLTSTSADASARWDPKWNGRKNFKSFRRARDANGTEPRRRPQKVIVPLIKAKKNSIGVEDQYWDSGPKAKQRGGTAQSQSQNQSQPRRATQSSSQTVSATNEAIEISSDVDSETDQHTSPRVIRLQAEAAAIVDHAVDTDSPRRTRLADKTLSANARSSQKRPASKSDTAGGRDKRQKTIPTTRDRGDESDSDGMKFKFGRRKKLGKLDIARAHRR